MDFKVGDRVSVKYTYDAKILLYGVIKSIHDTYCEVLFDGWMATVSIELKDINLITDTNKVPMPKELYTWYNKTRRII